MGNVSDTANFVYRDSETEGMPSTEPHEPIKSEIRDLFNLIDQLLLTATSGFIDRAAVDCATTANITLSGEQTIDGFLTSGSRVLAKDQSTAANRGVYITGAGAWTRATDVDTGAEMLNSAFYVMNGTVNKGRTYKCVTESPITIGVTDLVFEIIRNNTATVPATLDSLNGKGNSVAAAATTNIYTTTGNFIDISGTGVTVTALETAPAGVIRKVRWLDENTIQHNETSLILPNGFDLITETGDIMEFTSLGSGNWVLTNLEYKNPLTYPQEESDFVELIDDNDFIVAKFGAGQAGFAGVLFEKTNFDDFEITDEYGFILGRFGGDDAEEGETPDVETINPQPVSIIPYFGPILCGWEDEDTVIHIENIIENRSTDGPLVQGSILGADGGDDRGDVRLKFRTQTLGATAELLIRPRWWDGNVFAHLALTVGTAPLNPVSNDDPIILAIGDSITDNALAEWISDILTARGYTPTMTGTILGDDISGVSGAGLKSEGHSGWEGGDITRHVTDATKFYIGDGVGGPADVAAYFALTQIGMQNVNAFVRPSTGGDAPGDIVNGTVLDLSNYFTIFAEGATGVPVGRGVVPPDIYLWGFGTNDVRDRNPDTIEEDIYEQDTYFYNRVRAYDATAPIIRWIPGTPRDPSRDALWTESYIPLIKGAMRAIIDKADSNIILCPTWAFVDSDGLGYILRTVTADPVTGVKLTGYDDNVHPQNRLRVEMFRQLSAYIAAKFTGEI